MDARGITEEELVQGCERSNMDALTDWTCWAGKVVAF
jgi:sulfur relay (sulfurtransferase) complex TusBCD TusD component (DsrE family)